MPSVILVFFSVTFLLLLAGQDRSDPALAVLRYVDLACGALLLGESLTRSSLHIALRLRPHGAAVVKLDKGRVGQVRLVLCEAGGPSLSANAAGVHTPGRNWLLIDSVATLLYCFAAYAAVSTGETLILELKAFARLLRLPSLTRHYPNAQLVVDVVRARARARARARS